MNFKFDKMQEQERKKQTLANIKLQLSEREKIRKKQTEKREKSILKRMEELKKMEEK